MINWLSLAAGALWIGGLSLLLAALSYHTWLAGEQKRRWRDQLAENSFGRVAWLSILLIGVGLAAGSRQTWERWLWILFSLVALSQCIGSWRLRRRER
ncbi:MAG: hypothetical protein AB1791_08110 [Chloroflexota bacterium]